MANKKYKHIAVDIETYNRFMELNNKMTANDCLKRLLDEKENQQQ